MRKLILLTLATFFTIIAASAVSVYASPQSHFGTQPGRHGIHTENDFHTNEWERFSFNYHFFTGGDHRFDLGQPTTFNGQVPICPFSVNMRRDAQVSFNPPRYGIFSGNIPTTPSNHLFTQPVHPQFHQPQHWHDSNPDPRFDTLGHGVNAQPPGNPMHIQTTGAPTNNPPSGNGSFLPPTSI